MVAVIAKEKLKLRSFGEQDIMPFVTGINTKTIERDTTIRLPCTIGGAAWWISFIQDAEKRNPLPEKHFVIEVDEQFAGSIGIINIDEHKGELGYWLVDQHVGKGIMTQAVATMVDYAINELKLVRIFAPVLPHNRASARVLEKNGFIYEGTLKKYYKKDGKYVNALCYAWVGKE